MLSEIFFMTIVMRNMKSMAIDDVSDTILSTISLTLNSFHLIDDTNCSHHITDTKLLPQYR